ncbi:unnamed protein product [Rotaria sp. Silwood1]|nr:unnamed protein product [Rotaria sp. Silwood1]
MVKIQIFDLVVLILIVSLHANATDDNNGNYIKAAKGEINWQCTAKCTLWWKCRILGFFLRKCNKPAGCDCSKFAWER